MKSSFDKLIVVISVFLLVLVAGLSVFLESDDKIAELKSNVLTGATINKLAENGKQPRNSQARIGIETTTTDCWSTANSASETACEANDDCVWHEDAWGSWCELKGCWNLQSESACGEANTTTSGNFINKSLFKSDLNNSVNTNNSKAKELQNEITYV